MDRFSFGQLDVHEEIQFDQVQPAPDPARPSINHTFDREFGNAPEPAANQRLSLSRSVSAETSTPQPRPRPSSPNHRKHKYGLRTRKPYRPIKNPKNAETASKVKVGTRLSLY